MIVYVRVVPNSKVEIVERVSENEFVLKVREKAIDGAANSRVREILAREFGVAVRNVNIKTPRSRRKIVEITLSS